VVAPSVSHHHDINKNPSMNNPKRLHVSNIPFRFRDPDLRAMFGVSMYVMLLRLFLTMKTLQTKKDFLAVWDEFFNQYGAIFVL